MDDNQKIQTLKEYFETRDDVVMAFLFGSRAKRYARASSDWDIGVYFKSSSPYELDRKEDRDYPAEHEIWGDIVSLLHTLNYEMIYRN